MIKLEQTGVGTESHEASIRDTAGSSLLPVQAAVTGTVAFKVNGRVSPEAPWVELIASGAVDFLQAVSWVPYMQLEVTSGAGSVSLWIGDTRIWPRP